MDFPSSVKKTFKYRSSYKHSKPYEEEPILPKHHHYSEMKSAGDEITVNVDGGGDSSEEVLTCTSSQRRQRSEKTLLRTTTKTKSRLVDPPQPFAKPGRVSSGLLGEEGEEEEDSLFDEDIPEQYKRPNVNSLSILQWVSLILILAALIGTIFVPNLKKHKLRGVQLWKWEVFVLILICGRLVSGWGIRVVVFFIERNFMLRKRVLYFVYGLRNPVQNCIWLGVVLISWHFLFDLKIEEQPNNKFLRFLNRILVCFFVGTLLWLVKTLMVKVLASLFHVSKFFDRIQESLFNQYVIETLSGLPKIQSTREIQDRGENVDTESEENEFSSGKGLWRKLQRTKGQKFIEIQSIGKPQNGGGDVDPEFYYGKSETGLGCGKFRKGMSQKEKEGVSIDHLYKMNSKNVSAWSMKRLIRMIRRGVRSTLDEQILESTKDEESTQIGSEFEAKIAARKIFQNVAQRESRFIYLEDVMRFMREDEALKTMSLLGGSPESEKISKSTLKNWVVNAFRERRALALTLNDTKTAVNTLHQMVNVLVGIIIAIACLLILGIATSRFLLFISSQIVVVAFVFGNTCKTIFEAIIFLFVMHPFDVGDRCEIDGVQMVVEEMNILTTVFLRFDNQKIVYPNSTLSTKPISNYYRSPDMGDAIEFYVHIATPTEKISIMKQRIISYIESKKEHWYPCPTIVLMNLEELNKIKFSVWLTHRINYQDILEKWTRRALVVEEMILIFIELDVQYRFLPLDINIRTMPAPLLDSNSN